MKKEILREGNRKETRKGKNQIYKGILTVGGKIHSQCWKMIMNFSKPLKNSDTSNCIDLLLHGKGRNIPNSEERAKALDAYFCSIFGEKSAVAVRDNEMLSIPAATKEDVPTATQQKQHSRPLI